MARARIHPEGTCRSTLSIQRLKARGGQRISLNLSREALIGLGILRDFYGSNTAAIEAMLMIAYRKYHKPERDKR